MKGIVLKQWEVQAILDGRKSRLTRVLRLPKHIEKEDNELYTLYAEGTSYSNKHLEEIINYINSPYKVGDILYVKETFFQGDILNQNEDIEEWGVIIYAAGPDRDNLEYENIKWRPSIHMQEEIARIFLKVTGVRVERLQDITPKESKKEGFESWTDYAFRWSGDHIKNIKTLGWDANPWVWIIEFERISKEEAYVRK